MRLLFIKFLIFLLPFFIFTSDLLAKKLQASYMIDVAGINIGNLSWLATLEDDEYTISINLNNKGFLSNLYNFSGKYYTEGKIIKGELVPYIYTQVWKTKKKNKEVKILFDKNMVSSLILKPSESEAPRIDYLKIHGVGDPLSSFFNILINGTNKFNTIDGRRLYKMSFDNKASYGESGLKEILITNYSNIWADHKRNDLSYIYIKQENQLQKEFGFLPSLIKIKNKGLVFKLILNNKN